MATPVATAADALMRESTTVLHVTTHLVVVDVVVEDAQGHPVTDLKREDFQLKENGRAQRLSAFSFQQHHMEQTTRVARKLPDNVSTNVPNDNSSNALNIILLDQLNTSIAKQMMVRQALLQLLPTLPNGRPIAVYAMTEKLRLLHDFTTNPSSLQETAQNLAMQSTSLTDNAAAVTQPNPGSRVVQPASQSGNSQLPIGTGNGGYGAPTGPSSNLSMKVSTERFVNEQNLNSMDYRVQSTIRTLKFLARALSAYPGRKNVIWISQGFPFSIHPDASMGVERFDNTRNYAWDLAEVADAMMAAQVSVYPINASGLEVFGALNTIEAPHDTMRYLAEQTGGRAFIDTNDLSGAVARSIDDGATYYTFSYYSDDKSYDGKFRRIEIESSRPGLKLHYRPGYFAINPDSFEKQNDKQRARDFTEAMNRDSPYSTGLLFQAVVQPPSEKTPHKVEVNFFIDPRSIRYDSSTDGRHKATVECAVQVYDRNGKLVKTQAQRFNVNLNDDVFNRTLKSSFPCHQTFELDAGDYEMRLGVRDDRSGLIGTSNARITIEKHYTFR